MTREEQMMAAADAYAAGAYADEPVCFSTEEAICETINDFVAGWRAADAHPQWIPVEEELPEKENEFEDYSKLVVVTNGKDFWKGMYNYGGEEWLTFDLWRIDDATHWMPIVPPRKEDKK